MDPDTRTQEEIANDVSAFVAASLGLLPQLAPSRELSIVRTKLQEVQFWLSQALQRQASS